MIPSVAIPSAYVAIVIAVLCSATAVESNERSLPRHSSMRKLPGGNACDETPTAEGKAWKPLGTLDRATADNIISSARNGGEVSVHYKQFCSGGQEQVPLSLVATDLGRGHVGDTCRDVPVTGTGTESEVEEYLIRRWKRSTRADTYIIFGLSSPCYPSGPTAGLMEPGICILDSSIKGTEGYDCDIDGGDGVFTCGNSCTPGGEIPCPSGQNCVDKLSCSVNVYDECAPPPFKACALQFDGGNMCLGVEDSSQAYFQCQQDSDCDAFKEGNDVLTCQESCLDGVIAY